MQTTRESKLSLIGTKRNISKLIYTFDLNIDKAKNELLDIFQKKFPKDQKFDDIDQVLEICSELK